MSSIPDTSPSIATLWSCGFCLARSSGTIGYYGGTPLEHSGPAARWSPGRAPVTSPLGDRQDAKRPRKTAGVFVTGRRCQDRWWTAGRGCARIPAVPERRRSLQSPQADAAQGRWPGDVMLLLRSSPSSCETTRRGNEESTGLHRGFVRKGTGCSTSEAAAGFRLPSTAETG